MTSPPGSAVASSRGTARAHCLTALRLRQSQKDRLKQVGMQ